MGWRTVCLGDIVVWNEERSGAGYVKGLQAGPVVAKFDGAAGSGLSIYRIDTRAIARYGNYTNVNRRWIVASTPNPCRERVNSA